MCGRYVLFSSADVLAEHFKLAGITPLKPRYNIAPTQPAPVVRSDADGARRLDELYWGLIPPWAKGPAVGSRMINARAETAADKPAFRSAIRRRRCLVPADAFYEWMKLAGGGRQPFCIRMSDESQFALAGLWESRLAKCDDPEAGETEAIESFAILTTPANTLMKKLHDRMPVIIQVEDYDLWLDRDVRDVDRVRQLLKPLSADLMKAHPVSRRVNSPANDDPQCMEPIDDVVTGDSDAGLFPG